MRGAIMQPTYIPWLGYFAMIDDVDLFIFLDDVQLNKRSWQTRNRIKERDGKELMLSIPLHTNGRNTTRICDAIFAEEGWYKKHLASISNIYGKCEFYHEVYALIEKVFLSGETCLSKFNISLIEAICKYLGIGAEMTASSSMGETVGSKDALLVNICRKAGIDTYLSARGSAAYIEREKPGGAFRDAGIRLEYQNYSHPVYTQQGDGFMPYMSVIDLLFNYGRKSLTIIREGNRSPYVSEDLMLR